MVSLERTVFDEKSVVSVGVSKDKNNGNGNSQQTEKVVYDNQNQTEEIQLLIMSLEQRLSNVEKRSFSNKIVPLKEFNDIGRLLEGDNVQRFIEKVRLFRSNSDVLSLRVSYKQLYERSLKLLDEGEMILNKSMIERDGIRNLMGRIQEQTIK